MRVDAGIVAAIIIEYIIFVFYTDTLFYRKRNKYACYGIIAAGYVVHMAGCMFNNVILNTMLSVLVLFICMRLCYYINLKNAVFQSLLLAFLCLASEYLIVSIPYLKISPDDPSTMNAAQSVILTLTSRTLYLMCVMIFSYVFSKKGQEQMISFSGLTLIPMLTSLIIIFMIKTNITSAFLAAVCMILMIINVIVFAANQRMISDKLENAELKEQIIKEKADLEEYLLLQENYRETKIFRHDFKEHVSALNTLISSDNEQAKKYIEAICKTEEVSQFTDYSDNKILNVLLSKKKEECRAKDVKLIIDPISAHMKFLKNTDVVPIFSNLLNNAIEGCRNSEEKKIFLNISGCNENFIIIEVENTAETKPVVIDGKLKTHKDNPNLHGVGMDSIRRAIKKYSGSLEWEYDEDEKIFRIVVMVKST